MSSNKKADHRLVQPRPEHYVKRNREDGVVEEVLVGPYSLEQRDKYFDIHKSLYLIRHPDRSARDAKEATFHRWRNLVFSTIGDEYLPVKPGQKPAKEAVKLLGGKKNAK